ncbi:hypothetical protein BH18ACI2_BH18ACI2_17030 [soil metagenome]
METSKFNTFNLRKRLTALSLLVFMASAAAIGQAQQHDQHGGHVQPAAKRAVKKKKSAPRKKTTTAARRATKNQNPLASTHATHGTPHTAQPTPSPMSDGQQTQTPATQTTQPHAGTPHTTPAPANETAPETHDGHSNLPKEKSSPVENATEGTKAMDHGGHNVGPPAPVPSTDAARPTPAAQPAHDTHSGHNVGAGGTETNAMAVDADDIMVMSGDEMGVRVGRSQSNFMPMGQMGSGTAWQPATSPMHMWHRRAGDWLLMLHGEAKIGVNAQGGPRGVTKFESANWLMPMAYRRIGPGTLPLRGMFSFEPFTFPRGGSPLLFQTGETFRGRPLIDAQHPHDLFMELSAQYTMPLGERGTWFTYFGYPGEPALGPVAFMHRASAMENPSAPLTHHLQDSTHISFGVLTTGFTYRWFKLEGSIFNGREPDENRYDFEYNPWNSRSARLSFAPNKNWAFQISHGFLRNPEALEPGDTRRTTASVQYNRSFARGNLATAFIWGRNHETHDGELFNLNGYTFETTVKFIDKNYLYTRLELVDKKDLLRHEDLELLGFDHDFEHPQFRIGAYTFGYVRDVWEMDKLSIGVGGDMTFYSKPARLDQLYGRNPTSYKFFVRVRPGKMSMNHGGTTHGNH